VAYRLTKKPLIIGGLALGVGYCCAFIKRTPRPVSRELMAFHRREQMTKLKAILIAVLTFKRLDTFNVAQDSSVLACMPFESKGDRARS
jgi:hypothetical protein